MTENDLQKLESALGHTLPEYYRATMFAYPFPSDSEAAAYSLDNNPTTLLRNQIPKLTLPGIAKMFCIGGDGSEEVFFIDAENPDSTVYVYDMEAGTHRVLCKDWPQFLEWLRANGEDKAGSASVKSTPTFDKWVGAIVIIAIIVLSVIALVTM